MRRSLVIACVCLILLAPASVASASTYTVRPGDSLFRIARQFGTTVSTIRSLNGWVNTLIRPGQRLAVPDAKGDRYTVRAGDTFFLIGKKYGLSSTAIMRANGSGSSRLVPGQVLYIPVPQKTTSRAWLPNGSRDVYLLAQLITAEADDQSYKTKVAVGAVVLNRVQSSLFPNTIGGVIYDQSYGHYQFEPVMNGWINRSPSAEALRAARDALAGWDPTSGALYFFEPWVGNRYLHSLPIKAHMGAFVFC